MAGVYAMIQPCATTSACVATSAGVSVAMNSPHTECARRRNCDDLALSLMEVVTEAVYLSRIRRSSCSRSRGDNSGWMRDTIERHREAATAASSMSRTTTARTADAMDSLASLERRVEQVEQAAQDTLRAARPRCAYYNITL
jgi:hypothetical protein